MNILIIGSGGREHALADKISASPLCSNVFIAPGNAGTAMIGTNLPFEGNDFAAIKHVILSENIGLVIVGPEAPLVEGIVDYFSTDDELKNIPIIGPTKMGAMLEGSKAFAKEFMQRHNIPTAAYRSFKKDELEEALKYLDSHALPIVLKADGLAAGKGVIICQSIDEAQSEITEMLSGKFGAASDTVVIEQFLSGIEFSVFALTDGTDYVLLPEAKDYKRIGEGDTGLNTGGMGAVSPVPFADETFMQKVIQKVVEPTIAGLAKDNLDYKGFVFFGLIKVNDEPYVIEYNCRMGDPETEVVMPRLKSGLVPLLIDAAQQKLEGATVKHAPVVASTVMLVSGGYPGVYEKGKKIEGLGEVEGSIVFH